ncbi:MAG: RNA pyrophosphohydrolase [Alphaproteobacteria bacterium]
MADSKNLLPYRQGVGIMMLNKYNEIFVGQRIDSKTEAWQMPQGGIDEGETPRQAVFREVLEETGTDKIELVAESENWFYYDLPPHLASISWQGKYRGQKQKWFLARFLGKDSDFNLNYNDPAEFSVWRWISINELPNLIVSFKKDLYNQVINQFKDIIFKN